MPQRALGDHPLSAFERAENARYAAEAVREGAERNRQKRAADFRAAKTFAALVARLSARGPLDIMPTCDRGHVQVYVGGRYRCKPCRDIYRGLTVELDPRLGESEPVRPPLR